MPPRHSIPGEAALFVSKVKTGFTKRRYAWWVITIRTQERKHNNDYQQRYPNRRSANEETSYLRRDCWPAIRHHFSYRRCYARGLQPAAASSQFTRSRRIRLDTVVQLYRRGAIDACFLPWFVAYTSD